MSVTVDALSDQHEVVFMPEDLQSDETPDEHEGEPVEAPQTYTIDELAALTRVPSRTIRFYQSRKALPPPEKKGRVAFYSDAHVERLKLIARLQDQGLRIKAIRDLLARSDKGELVISEWLGLSSQMKAPWAEDEPKLLSQEAFFELVGERRDGLLSDLIRLGLAERNGDLIAVRSPALLRVTMELERAGVELEVSVESARMLRKHMRRAASEVADLFLRHFSSGEGAKGEPTEVFQTLRPMSLEAARLIFAQEMERAMRKAIETGGTTRVASRKRRRRTRRD